MRASTGIGCGKRSGECGTRGLTAELCLFRRYLRDAYAPHLAFELSEQIIMRGNGGAKMAVEIAGEPHFLFFALLL